MGPDVVVVPPSSAPPTPTAEVDVDVDADADADADDRRVLYINIEMICAKEGVKRKVKREIDKMKRLPPPMRKLAKKVAPNMASSMATPERVIAIMSNLLPEKLPENLLNKGMTAMARNVFSEDNFLVLEIRIHHVDITKMIRAHTRDVIDDDGDVERGKLKNFSLGVKILLFVIHYFFYWIGLSNKAKLEGVYLPRMVQDQMEHTMGEILAEKLEMKGFDAESTVLPEEKQARFFFEKILEMRKNKNNKKKE